MLRRCLRPIRSSCSRAASWMSWPATCSAIGRSFSTVTGSGRSSGLRGASGARTIDLSERTVLPGLIDCHAHLIGEMDEGQGYAYLVNRSSAQEALTGVTNALATLLGGVTTVRDVGTFHAFVDLALREAIEDGRLAGPG